MNLTPKLSEDIAKRYDGARDYRGKSDLDNALAEVIRRQGGLCAALTEDARRDLILTLGVNHRAHNAYALWVRHGGNTDRPWRRAYAEWLASVFRKATLFPAAAE